MKIRNLRYIIAIVIIVLLGVGIWGISEKIVLNSKTPNFIKGEEEKTSKEDEEIEERQEIETVRGTGLEQTGAYTDKAVQCVFDFFNENLPESDLLGSEYEIKDLGEENYCVYVGDWYVFVKGEYDLCYPYKFCKTTELTDYEMSFINDNNIELIEEDGLFYWEG